TGIFSPVLYQLSYLGKKMAEPTGFEPAISGVTGRRVRPLHHGSATLTAANRLGKSYTSIAARPCQAVEGLDRATSHDPAVRGSPCPPRPPCWERGSVGPPPPGAVPGP